MSAAVELRQAVKKRGGFRLGPIDLTLDSGLIVAVVGPNGSGKTTMFRLMSGLLQPDEGEVKLFGSVVTSERDVEVKSRIGFAGDIFQPLDEQMTVETWKRFVSRWYGARWNEAIWNRLSRELELEPKKKWKELSTGMKKRLSFALQIPHEPDLLLLDEPSSGLDPFAWRIMMEEIRKFMDEGERTAIIATHVMEEVRRLADVIVFLHGGRVLGVYEKDQLLDDWKTIWVSAPPEAVRNLPGVVALDAAGAGTARLITRDARRTEAALREKRLAITETRGVDLEDILWHVMQQDKREKRGVAE